MNSLVRAACWASLALISSPLASITKAREGKVEVVSSTSKELRRSAHRLRIPVDRLKNARQALQESNDLARRIRPIPFPQLHQLGELWLRLNRPKAEATISSLLAHLRSVAQEASSPGDYGNATSSARALITLLAQIDADESVKWARDWPPPSPSFGQQSNAFNGIERNLRRSALQQLAHSDPDAALKLLDGESSRPSDEYDLRGPLAAQLMANGRSEDANKIIDRTVAQFAAAQTDPASWNSYGNFLMSVPQVAPDRFLEAFELWARNAPPELNSPGGLSLGTGEDPVLLDSRETMALNVLRSIGSRPELTLKALDSLPSLQAKIEKAGGIDSALTNIGGRRGMAYIRNPGGKAQMAPRAPGRPPGEETLNELRGKTNKNPQEVRSKLSSLAADPETLPQLLNIAFMSAWQDPDLGCLAVEIARPAVLRAEPPIRQMGLFQQLVQATKQCEGEIDADLVKHGFILADEIREQDRDKALPQGPAGYSPADHLETMLLADLARDNFDAAIRYVRAMSADTQKFATLLAIAQSCAQQF